MVGLFFANLFGWVVARWRIFAVAAGLIVIIIIGGLVFRACKPKAKLNESEIQKGEQAVKERNDKELREILANVDAREEVIAGNVANAERETEKAKEESKKKYEAMNTDELAAELEKRK